MSFCSYLDRVVSVTGMVYACHERVMSFEEESENMDVQQLLFIPLVMGTVQAILSITMLMIMQCKQLSSESNYDKKNW